MTGRHGEAGYAMVAAVVAMALLAMMSLALIDSARGSSAATVASIERARLMAATDGGIAYAVDRLAAPQSERWSLDSRPHRLALGGARLIITVEDERGKVPINQLTEEQMRALFEAIGVGGAALDIAVDSLLDWLDDDDDARPDGAEAAYYAARGIVPRNGALRSVDELSVVRGITPAMIDRLRPEVSVARDTINGFDDRHARPLALAVMSGSAIANAAAISRARELAGDRVAIDLAGNESLTGRPLSIRLDAYGPGAARLLRRVVIELTGRRVPAYIVRQND